MLVPAEILRASIDRLRPWPFPLLFSAFMRAVQASHSSTVLFDPISTTVGVGKVGGDEDTGALMACSDVGCAVNPIRSHVPESGQSLHDTGHSVPVVCRQQAPHVLEEQESRWPFHVAE